MSYTASDIADWYDNRVKTRKAEMLDWVGNNPQWWAIAWATIATTDAEFVGGLLDPLRLGEGATQGGVKGVVKDALRIVSIVPAGRLLRHAGLARRAAGLTRDLKLAIKVKGITGPCTFQAANNAMQIVIGKSAFVTVREMARAAGKAFPTWLEPVGRWGQSRFKLAAWIDDLLPFIRSMGARAKPVEGLKSVSQVVELARREGAPVVFAFKTTARNSKGEVQEILHTVIAVRDKTGVKFADYGGKLFGTLDDLCRAHWGPLIAPIQLLTKRTSAVVVTGTVEAAGRYASLVQSGAAIVLSGLHVIETPNSGAEFAFPAVQMALAAPEDAVPAAAQMIKESFENHIKLTIGEPVIATKPADHGGIPKVELLTGVQYRLNHLGFGAGSVDGIAGKRTRKAIEAFQKYHSPLRVDGIPGPRTQAKLAEICGY